MDERELFDRIAPGWYGFRHHSIFTLELEALARRWEKGRLLNVGCGHGPDFVPFRGGFELYGIDFSPRMLEMASRYSRKFNFSARLTLADARRLPFEDGIFDWAIAVAVYHHIKGREERLRALEELGRVLKPGGEAFITVWNRCQPRFWFSGREVKVPWRAGDETIYRYYYLFNYAELEKLARQAGFELLEFSPESRYRFPLKWFSRNICLLLRKPGIAS